MLETALTKNAKAESFQKIFSEVISGTQLLLKILCNFIVKCYAQVIPNEQ